jgi:hypothetical protein
MKPAQQRQQRNPTQCCHANMHLIAGLCACTQNKGINCMPSLLVLLLLPLLLMLEPATVAAVPRVASCNSCMPLTSSCTAAGTESSHMHIPLSAWLTCNLQVCLAAQQHHTYPSHAVLCTPAAVLPGSSATAAPSQPIWACLSVRAAAITHQARIQPSNDLTRHPGTQQQQE